jgi:hypothetical protein
LLQAVNNVAIIISKNHSHNAPFGLRMIYIIVTIDVEAGMMDLAKLNLVKLLSSVTLSAG